MSIPCTDSFLVRTAKAEDLPSLSALFDSYRQFYGQPADPEACLRFMQQRMEQGDARQLVAQDPEGSLLGFVQLYPLWSSVRMKPLWLLNDLYVAESSRSKGVGSALLEAAKTMALQTGACGLSLETSPDNRKAKSLYERSGFDLQTHHFYFWPA